MNKMNANKTTPAARLRALRDERDESQASFAIFLGCSQGTVSKLESGGRIRDIVLLRRLESLGFEIDDFAVAEALEVA